MTQDAESQEPLRKGDHGTVLVVGGSAAYRNTPGIVAVAALRSGCDIVQIAAPEPSLRNASTFAMNITTTGLAGDRLNERHVDTILAAAEEVDCAVIGPGLGRDEETQAAVHTYLSSTETPTVVDADALHVVAEHDVDLQDCVLTPHDGEFTAMTGNDISYNLEERKAVVTEYADEQDCTVLLKGPTDVISDGETVLTSDTGNPYMTRGGTGDVLSGITAALIAQEHPLIDAAHTAARINGIAGDHAVEEHGRGFLLDEHLYIVSHVIGEEV